MKNSIFVSLLLSFFVVSCQSKETGKSASSTATENEYSGPPVKNDWMVLWLSASPQILNPIISTDTYGTAVMPLVFDRLITYDNFTGEPVGWLAESWKVSEDGLTYDFYIRKNAKFHDGVPVTAADVKFTFDRIKDPKVDAAHIQNYYSNLVSVDVVGPHHVRFNLSNVYFRNLIMLGLAEIMPKHIYEKGDFNKHPANRAPVGSGPYKFVKWDTGRLIELERNTEYWGNEDDYWKNRFNFNRILFRVITEDSVASIALKNGEIDMLEPTPEQYVKDFVGEEFEKRFYRLKYSTIDGNGYRYIGWNLRLPMFSSKNVRKALAMAMPREVINQRFFDGLMKLSVGPMPSKSPKMDPDLKPIPFEPETAKKLLADEGWTDSDGDGLLDKDGKKFEFELLFTAQVPELEKIALIYQRSLEEIGIKMNIRTLEWTVFIKNVMEANFEALMMGWGAALDQDPYQIWHSSQIEGRGSNRVAFKNERVDTLLEQARTTLDQEKRNEMYQEFSRIIADEAPYLFLFERPSLSIVDRRFQKVVPIGQMGLDPNAFFTPLGREKYSTKATQE